MSAALATAWSKEFVCKWMGASTRDPASVASPVTAAVKPVQALSALQAVMASTIEVHARTVPPLDRVQASVGPVPRPEKTVYDCRSSRMHAPVAAVIVFAAASALRASAVKVLREAARIAEDGGATILLEPVHMVIHGNLMAVRNIRQGLDLVEEVGSPALKVLADVFHNAVDGQSFEDAFADRIELVGHVQVADLPGRHEPGTGDLPWATLPPLLRQRGYDGPIGLEYLPSLPIAESLALTRRSLGL